MITLNLVAENDCQQAIKDYLEHNVSEVLAHKINNGIKIEKDGKSFINKKTLTQFWAYATKKAQEMKTGYVANDTVFGWAIHYFEEDEIIGTLYNEDGSEYTPPKPEYKPIQRIPAPTIPQKPKPTQASLFDLLTSSNEEQKEEKTQEEIVETVDKTEEEMQSPALEELNDNSGIPTHFDVDEETGEILSPIPNLNLDDDLEEMRAQVKHIDKDALCILLDLFEYELDVQ